MAHDIGMRCLRSTCLRWKTVATNHSARPLVNEFRSGVPVCGFVAPDVHGVLTPAGLRKNARCGSKVTQAIREFWQRGLTSQQGAFFRSGFPVGPGTTWLG